MDLDQVSSAEQPGSHRGQVGRERKLRVDPTLHRNQTLCPGVEDVPVAVIQVPLSQSQAVPLLPRVKAERKVVNDRSEDRPPEDDQHQHRHEPW